MLSPSEILRSFSCPAIDAVGGPFRAAGAHEAYVVRGSSSEESFLELFELIQRDARAGKRVYDEAAFPFRRDEWWSRSKAQAGGREGRGLTQRRARASVRMMAAAARALEGARAVAGDPDEGGGCAAARCRGRARIGWHDDCDG